MHMHIFVNVHACMYTYMCMQPMGGPGEVGNVNRASARGAPKTDYNTHTHLYLGIFMYICIYVCICIFVDSLIYIPVGSPGEVRNVNRASARCAPKTDYNTHICVYMCIYIYI